ncbi:MAG: sugar ABC transporter ATP-binding protein [Pirellulales bacterium]
MNPRRGNYEIMIDVDLIQLERISKRFGGVTALEEVSFGIRRGEVHALVGENGAGKSTLMKVLAGVHAPDDGTIRLGGKPVRFANPRDAGRHGVRIVFQELNLFPSRSVAANVFANREWVGRCGWVRRRTMDNATRDVLRNMGSAIEPGTLVGSLTIGEQQLVEIARSLVHQSRIIILDEPNSALNEAESQRLFEIVRQLRDRGLTIIYVSHRLEEVLAIADRISILRDGRLQGTLEAARTSIPEVIEAMIGRRLEQAFPARTPSQSAVPPAATAMLQVRNVRHGDSLGPISFDVRGGEILGFAGLEDGGVNGLFRVLFGLQAMHGGELIYRGQQQTPGSARQAIARGWGLIPESRRDQGLLMDWSIARNTTLLVLDKLCGRLGFIDRRAVRATTDHFLRRLNVITDGQEKKVVDLSGGNQQKVLLAKWLATRPALLMLNDPTRGVDVGAKWEIYQLCRQLAAEGLAILFTSSEADEILGLSDRVLVLRKGKLVREFQRGEANKAELIHAMSGGEIEAPRAAEPSGDP